MSGGPRVDRLLCIYGRPRTGTTSIAGEMNRSPIYCIWVEKDLWTGRSYADLDELLGAAARPGGTSAMARSYNDEVVSRKSRFTVLGDKSTWKGTPGRADGLERILTNLSTTAREIGVDREVVACVREPLSWLASWSMTHYLTRKGTEEGFWSTMTESPAVRSELVQELEVYGSYLESALAFSEEPWFRIRCLERTRPADLDYLFDFGEYLRGAAPPAARRGRWPERLARIKMSLERRLREGWIDAGLAGELYSGLLARHRPCPILEEDGSVREV